MGRYFGWVADATLAGTGFDDLNTPGPVAVPAPVQAWPVISANVDPGREVRERTNEIRGGRGSVAPTITRHTPTATASLRAYPELTVPLLFQALGATSRTGTAPAAFTDTVEPSADSALYLPGAHIAVERDGLFQQIAGAKLRSLNLNLPLDDDGTVEVEYAGLFLHRPAAPTWPKDFTYLGDPEWVFQLRDAKAYENGSVTSVDCLRGFTLAFNDLQRDPDFCAGKNVENRTVSAKNYRIWWPEKYRVAPRRNITGTIEFTGVDGTREAMADVARAEQIVLSIEARNLATTPAAIETLEITLHQAAFTGGGPGELSRDDDINTSMEFMVAIDQATGDDITIEYLNDNATGVAIPTA